MKSAGSLARAQPARHQDLRVGQQRLYMCRCKWRCYIDFESPSNIETPQDIRACHKSTLPRILGHDLEDSRRRILQSSRAGPMVCRREFLRAESSQMRPRYMDPVTSEYVTWPSTYLHTYCPGVALGSYAAVYRFPSRSCTPFLRS